MKTLNLFSVAMSVILALNMEVVIAEGIPVTTQDQIQMSSENLQHLQGKIDQGNQPSKGHDSSHYGQGYESRSNGQGSNGTGGGKGKQRSGKH